MGLARIKTAWLQTARSPAADPLDAAIKTRELGWHLHVKPPKLTDMSKEKEVTEHIYGIDEKNTDKFGKQSLLARRNFNLRGFRIPGKALQ